MLHKIYRLLQQLGVTTNYTGFFYTAYAVEVCVERPEYLLAVTKWLYPKVADHYSTSWQAVERNIRTVSAVIWRENRALLEALAHRQLSQKTHNAQLLAILAAAVSSDSPEPGGTERNRRY